MRQYAQQEAEEILQRAVHREFEDTDGGRSAGSMMTDDDLVKTAEEIGISKEAVYASVAEWQTTRSDKAERQEFDRERRLDWTTHLTAYVIVNAFLMAMDFWMTRRLTWSVFPLLGWGIGMAFHTAGTFVRDSDYEPEFAKWREKRRKRIAKEQRNG